MTHSNFWKDKNIFITGINGFVGGNLAKACCDQGANVIGLIRNMKKDTFLFYEGIADRVNLIQGDILNKELLTQIMVEERIDCCFHLAAQVEVGIAKAYPFLTWETNIRGTYALLEAVRESGDQVGAVIIASSDKAYGDYPMDQLPYREDYPLIPSYPYDVSKACADMIARSYASNLYNLPIIITRFCNIYGPGQLNFSALIPDATRSALGYSQFVPRSNGLLVRDYIYIEDVVELYMLFAVQLSLDKKLRGEIFNAGTNQPKQVKDIVNKIYNILNKEEKYLQIEAMWTERIALGEIDYQYMSYDKINKYFNWSPKVNFDDGLRKTVNWYIRYFKDS